MHRITHVLVFTLLQLLTTYAMDCSGKQTALDIAKEVDLSGQTHVLTGGDSGLGYETALALASAKARVILACRSRTKCPAAAANITRITSNRNVSVVPLDLSSFDSAREAAATIRRQVGQIDVLINNAGIDQNPSSLPPITKDGFDRVFQVNFLSLFLFVNELLPLLRQSKTRVVTVASQASVAACLWGNYGPGCTSLGRLPKLAKESPTGRSLTGAPASNYGVTKYMEIFATAELARREPNITAFSLHPGVVGTAMLDNVPWIAQKLWCAAGFDFQNPCPRTTPQGASTQTYIAVATQEELMHANGKFFDSCKVHSSVRDQFAATHGEEKAVAYQSAIYDIVSQLTGSGTALMV
jgi:NAD(P)-dependent dehydrogenase (short-subunit alcohol dehydrogenase family)